MPEHPATPIHEHRYTYPTVIALPPRWSERHAPVFHPAAAFGPKGPGDLTGVRPQLPGAFARSSVRDGAGAR